MSHPLSPGSVIGMLGSGQLGRMTALAAAPLGLRTHVFAPEPGPATLVTDLYTRAAYDDEDALARFAATVDVVTYEFENVPARTAAFLAGRVPVRPGPAALGICQHRVSEKTFLRDAGIPTTGWRAVSNAAEVAAAADALGRPCVLKTARFGYDGKGQTIVRPGTDAADAWRVIAGDKAELDAIVEAFVDFRLEASVVVARGFRGEVAAYELVENRHRDHILHQTIVPADVSDTVRTEADAIARTVVEALDYVGVLGVEMFVTHDGQVLVNELAPRPHNSGHWTQDGAVTCQFEQHARAVAGLPLGSVARVGDAVMTNLLGDDVDQVPTWLAEPHAKVHLYGKTEARAGRKMGHVNVISPRRG
ncbi:MAG: 5-(carboxyamino)imidazole ribonucleotide synthase [Alphaproteobacteria bacterium]|nr:5-(carboxyamino)imidazole ribonucleotide synthase [Alphaproteobacteria bacterium]